MHRVVSGGLSPRVSGTVWLAAALAVTVLIPTSESLWIDESTTALYARAPSLSAFFDKLYNDFGSDAQQPLGNFVHWAAARVVGTSEYALRAVSALWIAVAVVVAWRVGQRIDLPYLPGLLVCHPLVWQYGGEARPYSMLIALGWGLTLALVVVYTDPAADDGVDLLVVFAPLVCATSMLGAILIAAVSMICSVELARRRWRPTLGMRIKLLISGTLIAVFGVYYLWTLLSGKGAHSVRTWTVGLENVAFAAYELLGFSGLGPSRHELRAAALEGGLPAAVHAVATPASLGFTALIVAYLAVGWWFARQRFGRASSRTAIGSVATTVAATTFAVLLGLSILVGFPFWGRHLVSILAFIVCAIACTITDAASISTRPARLVLSLLMVTLLASSLLLRFNPHHARDDYRTAVAIAEASIGDDQTVWWTASDVPAIYYDLELCNVDAPPASRCAHLVVNATARELAALPVPDRIIASKPDLFDRTGAVRAFVQGRGYIASAGPPAFIIYERDR